MSDGREQYADSAFNKAAEAAMEAYRKKHYETWHMGEVDVGAPLQQLAIDMAQKGADMTAAALWAPPRNQYEPLFPRGAALNNLPSTSSTLTGRQPSAPVFQQYPDVITQGDTRYARPSPLAQPVQSMFPERDPDGLDPHTPGAKLDAGKTPLRKGTLEQFPRALMAVADVSAFGAAKYTWGGWQTVPDGVQRYLDAGARHAALRAMGESYDKDSGLFHLAQEAWNILAALELALRKAHDKI